MKMPGETHDKFGHKASGREYCRGYTDVHGQWNNGFFCPRWGPRDRDYCCGTERHRFCCPPTTEVRQTRTVDKQHVALATGLVVGCLVLVFMAVVALCYFCRCCWVYKRRKAQHGGLNVHTSRHRYSGDAGNIAVRFTVCPHTAYYDDMQAGLPHSDACVYDEHPPPYSGTFASSSSALDDKLPLDEVHGLVQPSVVFNLPPKHDSNDTKLRQDYQDVTCACSGGATSRTMEYAPISRLLGCPHRHSRVERKKRRSGKKTNASLLQATNTETCQCREHGIVIPNAMLVRYTTPNNSKIDQV